MAQFGVKQVLGILNDQLTSLGLTGVETSIQKLRSEFDDQCESVEIQSKSSEKDLINRIDALAENLEACEGQSRARWTMVQELKALIGKEQVVIEGIKSSLTGLIKSTAELETKLSEKVVGIEQSLEKSFDERLKAYGESFKTLSKELVRAELKTWEGVHSNGWKQQIMLYSNGVAREIVKNWAGSDDFEALLKEKLKYWTEPVIDKFQAHEAKFQAHEACV